MSNSVQLFSQKPVYFGGSRSIPQSELISQVVQAVIESGAPVHVGCQLGADLQVVQACPPSSLVAFAVAGMGEIPNHLQVARFEGARVISCAGGGPQVPIKARYLLRSKTAFQGCSAAVFFAPGSGSLAVAREAVAAGLPVFAFWVQASPPPAIPSTSGEWVRSSFAGFGCWQFQPDQVGLF